MSFASRIASASSLNGMIATTGPKISSRTMRMSVRAPSKMVGIR